LYSEPVTPQGAELSWFADGGYPIPHFSAFGIVGAKGAVCTGEHGQNYFAGEDFCQQWVWAPGSNEYWNTDHSASVAGYATVGTQCGMEAENCMIYTAMNCLPIDAVEAFEADPNNTWITPGELPNGWAQIYLASADFGCTAITPPASCS